MKVIIGIMYCALLASCVTGKITVTSFPSDSQVIVKDTRGEIKASGKTPFTLDLSKDFFSQTDFAVMEIEQNGFVSQSYVVPKTYFNTDHTINVTLKKNIIAQIKEGEDRLEIDQCEQVSKKSMNELSKGIALAQSSMMRNQWQGATVKLSDLITQYPFVSVLHDLQGNVHYLQKNYDQALAFYERSLQIDPQNVETAIMVRKLRQITGKSQKGSIQ